MGEDINATFKKETDMRNTLFVLSLCLVGMFATSVSAEDPLPIGKVTVQRHERVLTSAPEAPPREARRIQVVIVREYVPYGPYHRHSVGFGWNFYAGRLHPCQSSFPYRMGGQVSFGSYCGW